MIRRDARLDGPRAFRAEELPEDAETFRVAQCGDVGPLKLVPIMADRLVVSRPKSPFRILPGQHATLFVSTPAWVRIALGNGKALAELPLFRPSDTWFGPSTLVGELGYAARTHCRLDVCDVPFRPHRAVTPLRVENRSSPR